MPFVCVRTTYVVKTVHKLVHPTRIEAQKCVVAGTVSKGSAHQVEMGIEVIVSLLPPNDPQIQISRTSYNILRGKPKVFFAKAGLPKEEKLSLKHVPA